MANRSLFRALVGRLIPATNVVNEAGGVAYAFSPRHALAQCAGTGCLNGTYYANDGTQLNTVLRLAAQVEPEMVARAAVYCRQRRHMKDMPAQLCAILAARSPELLARVFPRVIDNARMLRNFVQIVRSGVVDRKSFGSLPRRLVCEWLGARSDAALFRASVGQAPSLADVVRMVHPRPANPQREALYGYLLGREVAPESLPPLVQGYEAFKDGRSRAVPDVPFELRSALHLDIDAWTVQAALCGDLNCDGTVNFGDVKPFVQQLSNFAAWTSTYPACDPRVGDIDGDGTYGQGSFRDINPFVALLAGTD